MKTLLSSKTFQIAVIQAIGGLLIVALTQLDAVGYVAIVKSVIDILVRMNTSEPIGSIV